MSPKSVGVVREKNAIKSKQAESGRGWSALSLCLASIVEIHWEEMRCTLEIIQGQGDRDRALTGVELLMPSMGSRHFMGGIPEIGDQCVVGWFAHDTRAGTSGKTPAILAWWPSSSWIKHDWHMTQGFDPEEDVLESNTNRQILKNFYHRIRHKMRHFSPGNIGASSSQGSDMVLDESVLLSNRRANEIIIRDQDQAIVMRSLQQFHAMSGTRVYAGMVQRDARTLPKEMFSDGIKWDSEVQIDNNGNPYNPFKSTTDFFENPKDIGLLQPHPVFDREEFTGQGRDIEGTRTNFTGSIPLDLDPYVFLYNAGLICEEGFSVSEEDDTIYGGKSILRVGTKHEENAFSKGQSFTEYRIEMNHTADGSLPVTEQTDGFDSDRASINPGQTNKPPFIEWVLGTPVGNDAFSTKGIESYGLPITPTRETLDTATSSTPFGDHAATLLRVTPVVPKVDDSFVSFTKGGKFRAKISSPLPDSFEARVEGGAFFEVEGDAIIQAKNSTYSSVDKTLFSTGTFTVEASSSAEGESLVGDESNVSVIIKGNKRVSIQSETAIAFKAPIVDFSQVGQLRLSSTEAVDLNSGGAMNTTANTIKQSSMGQFEQVCGGPADFNPVAGPSRKVTITESPATGGAGLPSDSYTNAFGGRSEIYVGPATNTRTLTTATEATTIGAGASTTTVGTTATLVDPTGHKFIAPTGVVTATAGTVISMTANVVAIRGNSSVVISGASVTLASPGTAMGPIVCGSDIHPILGIPYALITGPKAQNLAQSV
jgi:hypothetical protein